MNKIWSIIEKLLIAIFAPVTPMEPTPINPSNSTSTPQTATISLSTSKPVLEAPSAPTAPFTVIPWDTQKHNWHNTRVLCDLAGLTLEEKNVICACLYQESQFYNFLPSGSPVTHANVVNGKVASIDYGIAQVNNFYHIGVGKDFSSVAYVMDNPDKVIEWMISMYQHGLLKQWCSYSSGAYLQWLESSSPMWALAD